MALIYIQQSAIKKEKKHAILPIIHEIQIG